LRPQQILEGVQIVGIVPLLPFGNGDGPLARANSASTLVVNEAPVRLIPR
jgi:hypothetical protein